MLVGIVLDESAGRGGDQGGRHQGGAAVLADGGVRAEAIAVQTLDAVKDIVGFVRRGPSLQAVR